MPTLTAPSTVTFPLQIDQILTLTTNFGTGNVTLSAQKSGDIVYPYSGEQMQDSPVFSPGSQGLVTITHLTGSLTYNVSTSAFPLFENTPRVLFQSAIPFILAGGTGGFTAGASGAISGLPTLQLTYNTPGAWLYLTAGVYPGQPNAGWYWFVASSTTAGTVYNNRYTGDPRPPSVLVPFTGAGATVTVGNAEIVGPVFTVPGGSMGPYGHLDLEGTGNYSVLASNFKSWRITFGTFTALAAGADVNTFAGFYARVMNRNSQSVNVFTPNGAFSATAGPNAGSHVVRSVNTAVDQPVSFTMQLPNTAAAEFMVWESYRSTVRYGA